MKLAAWIGMALTIQACTPSPAPVAPVTPDANADAGCWVIDKINAARLIRNPDGTAMVVPCDAGK